MGITWLIMEFIFLFVDENKGVILTEGSGESNEILQYFDVTNKNIKSEFIDLNIVSYVLIIITIIFCIFLIKKFLSKNVRKFIENEGVRQYRSFLTDNDNLSKKNKFFKNGLNQIRHWYRKFLVLCHKKNMDICIYDNSQSIYEKSCDVFVNSKEELESIKEIYRKARYSNETIDGNDIKRIKSFYKKLENEKNSKDK